MLKLGEVVVPIGATTSPSFNKIGSKTKKFYYRTVFVRVSFFLTHPLLFVQSDYNSVSPVISLVLCYDEFWWWIMSEDPGADGDVCIKLLSPKMLIMGY